MVLVLVMTCKEKKYMKRKNTRFSYMLLVAAMTFISGCAWHDLSRVDSDFGLSVKQMVAEQIFDPETASEPAVYGPATLSGNTADAAIAGYEKASAEARIERTRNIESPIPAVGIISGTEE